ncbi:hypothetical protein CHARACLAT_028494, partial [Characodon lateralis]|nr:hypothetical protein [Characodon lateralis]
LPAFSASLSCTSSSCVFYTDTKTCFNITPVEIFERLPHNGKSGAVGCHCAASWEHSGAKGLAQGPRVAIYMEEIQAIDIQRLSRAQEPQDNHRQHCRNTPPEKSRGESLGNHPAAIVQKPQGAAAMSPQAPPAAFYARADPAMDPRPETPGHNTPQAEARPSPGV